MVLTVFRIYLTEELFSGMRFSAPVLWNPGVCKLFRQKKFFFLIAKGIIWDSSECLFLFNLKKKNTVFIFGEIT